MPYTRWGVFCFHACFFPFHFFFWSSVCWYSSEIFRTLKLWLEITKVEWRSLGSDVLFAPRLAVLSEQKNNVWDVKKKKKNKKKWDRVDILFCTVLSCCSICSSNSCGNCWTALWLWSLQCSSCVPLTSSGEMELVCYGSIVSQRQMGSIKNLIKSSCNQPMCVWG